MMQQEQTGKQKRFLFLTYVN